MGLSVIWKKIARQEASNSTRQSRVQFWPVASELHSNPCGYVIIRHLANNNN